MPGGGVSVRPGVRTAGDAVPARGRLDALYVQEAHRGKGAGKALCRAFAALAAERGAVKMELKVFCRNAPALGLYEALGFRETKKYMERPL